MQPILRNSTFTQGKYPRRQVRIMVLGENQKATIISNQMQAIILNPIAPTDPLITRRTLPRGGGKADECQPFIMMAGNIPQSMPDFW